jgi:hypothetical protein
MLTNTYLASRLRLHGVRSDVAASVAGALAGALVAGRT